MNNKKDIILLFIILILILIRFFYLGDRGIIFDNIIGQEVIMEGLVIESPDIRENTQHLTVELLNTNIKILVISKKSIEVFYGDHIEIIGVLKEPENFITDNGKEFNYKRYLANQEIYYLIKNGKINIISNNNGNFIKAKLFKFRNKIVKNINNIIPNPESNLANGLVLGIRGGFDKDTHEDFIKTGTVHIIALSGYNVSIIAEGVMNSLSFVFSQTLSIIFGMIVIVLFIIMTGANATAIRAGIMAIIMLFGRITERRYMAGRALVIAGLLMILYNPKTILDMSFQLSFIATGGVLFLTPKIMKYFKFLTLRYGIREMFASTIAATISVLPIILYLTGVFSLVSIPANILILLFIPIAMLFIFFTSIFSFVFPLFAVLFGYVSYLILLYILSIIGFFGKLTYSSVNIQKFPLILVILIYLYLIYYIFKKKVKEED